MSRGIRRGLIALVVLLGLLVAADRISLAVAENVAANSLETSQHLDSQPSVSATGFPFLTQLVSGHFDEIDVTARGLQLGPGGRRLRVDTVRAVLDGVHTSHGFGVIQADTASATALIKYADLSRTLGSTVTYAGGGRVQASAGVTIAGTSLRGSVSVRPGLGSSNTLTFGEPQVSALGVTAPAALSQALAAIFAEGIPLAGLPFGMHFTAISAAPTGIAVGLHGANVVYDSRHH